MECPHRTRKGTIQTRRDVFKGEDAAEGGTRGRRGRAGALGRVSAGAFKAHFFQDNVDRVQCVWRPRRREGDPRKHIAKMLNEVICHCCNEPRTDGPGEREFPGKIGDDGDGPLVLLSFMCLLRLRSDYAPSASVGFARIDDGGSCILT